MSDQEHESRILINFDIRKNKIQSVDIPYKATENYFLQYKGHHYYTVFFYPGKKTIDQIIITKYTRGILVPTYEDHFCCSPPRNVGDYFDCNGIKGNIYAWVR